MSFIPDNFFETTDSLYEFYDIYEKDGVSYTIPFELNLKSRMPWWSIPDELPRPRQLPAPLDQDDNSEDGFNKGDDALNVLCEDLANLHLTDSSTLDRREEEELCQLMTNMSLSAPLPLKNKFGFAFKVLMFLNIVGKMFHKIQTANNNHSANIAWVNRTIANNNFAVATSSSIKIRRHENTVFSSYSITTRNNHIVVAASSSIRTRLNNKTVAAKSSAKIRHSNKTAATSSSIKTRLNNKAAAARSSVKIRNDNKSAAIISIKASNNNNYFKRNGCIHKTRNTNKAHKLGVHKATLADNMNGAARLLMAGRLQAAFF
ncbi:hypothetical protein BGX29_009104 [Mortierella sp. GBA35]|nr:hypothetical protein BGX29_009104 [Mortierella sp. GBA35]